MSKPLATALLLALLTPTLAAARSPAPPLVCCRARQGVGVGTNYDAGRMERVVRIRAQQGYPMRWDIPHVALPDCALIGRTVWVRAKQTAGAAWSAWTEAQSADCSQRWDWGWHTLYGKRVWVELGHPLAARWHVGGRFVVEVRW